MNERVVKNMVKNHESFHRVIKYKLTIMITVYNQEELIIRALNSVPKRNDIEVLIINDCSTDNTLNAVNEWINNNKEVYVRVINNEKNLGIGLTRNVGYDNAQGEYIHSLDSDDYLYTEEYNKVIDMLDGTDIVYINLQTNNGTIFNVDANTQSFYCAGIARFIRKEFLGTSRCPDIRACEDLYLNEEIQARPHTDNFTGIIAYHYNHPREGSLCDLVNKGQI